MNLQARRCLMSQSQKSQSLETVYGEPLLLIMCKSSVKEVYFQEKLFIFAYNK